MARIAETRIKQEDKDQSYIRGRTDKLCSLLFLLVHEAVFEDKYIDEDMLLEKLRELSELTEAWVKASKDRCLS